MKYIQKNLLRVLFVLVAIMVIVPTTTCYGAKKIKLSKTKVTMTAGQKNTVKIKNTKKKVTWKIISGKKNISIKRSGKTGVVITAKKKGSAKIQAKVSGKKYICNITVKSKSRNIEILVNGEKFKIKLYNNKTANQLLKMLPMTIRMNELNGNEKYHFFSREFAENESEQSQINTGDLMLFGSDCIVLFYDDFRPDYSYTPLGKMTNSKGLKAALGTGDVSVTFQLAN